MNSQLFKEISDIIEIIRDCGTDELELIKQYIDALQKNDFKELFHKFIDAHSTFLEEKNGRDE